MLAGLGLLALISTVFGMMAAVSRDLSSIYNFAQFKASKNSVVFDSQGPANRHPDERSEQDPPQCSGQISANVKNAVVAVEDARFYEHNGVDFQGIGRALVQDVLSRRNAQPGRIDDHPAVGQERARGTGRPDGIREKFREAALCAASALFTNCSVIVEAPCGRTARGRPGRGPGRCLEIDPVVLVESGVLDGATAS